MSPDSATPQTLVADLFRRESGRLTALLVGKVGPARLDLVEDAVQDALVAAMRNWSIHGVPRNPSAWLYVSARNALHDRLRRQHFELSGDMKIELAQEPDSTFSTEAALDDEQLNLIAYCCHPALSAAAQLALTLRLACGLSVEEIAGALLTTPESISQRIVRAKRELRALAVTFDVSARELVEERLPRILNAIYLLFDAGYLSTHHQEWLRPLLCEDALRLSRMLAAHPTTAEPETHALAALLHLAAARMPARADAAGRPITLAHQDRSKWNASLMGAGFRYLDASIRGGTITRYHVEAAIAAAHARAHSIEATDWSEILALYDQLCELYPSPVANLNRVIALRYARGPEAAFAALVSSDELDALHDSLVYHATMGELQAALGEHAKAADAFSAAAAVAGSDTLAETFRRRANDARRKPTPRRYPRD